MFPVAGTVLLWSLFLTRFELWSVVGYLVPWYLQQEQCIENEEENEFEDESEEDPGEPDEIELDYWGQVKRDIVRPTGSSQWYYPGVQPDVSTDSGPLIASHAGKIFLNIASSPHTTIQWNLVPRITRFIVCEPDGAVLCNVRKSTDVFEAYPSLGTILPSSHTLPLFQASTSLEVVRKALTASCSGLRHLEFDHGDSECMQSRHAPPTLVMRFRKPKDIHNWRLHELWCCRGTNGWYVTRTFETETDIYVYVYFHMDAPHQWTTIASAMDDSAPFSEWYEQSNQFVKYKYNYFEPKMLDYLESKLWTNHWTVVRVPH